MANNTEAIEEMQAAEQAENATEGKAQKAKQAEKAAEETAKIRLPFIAGVMEDDVFVGLNGRTFLIKRGVEVEVPLGVKEILDRTEKYEMEANAAAMRLQSRSSEPGRGI